MDKKLLQSAFREYKKLAKLDYAITRPDRLGDCNTCVNYELVDRYGEDSRGIFCKHWTTGMNAGHPIERLDKVYVAHDLTEEQGKQFIELFSKYFRVTPEKYNPDKCFCLFPKDAKIYKIVYYSDEVLGGKAEYEYTNKAAADNWINKLKEYGYSPTMEEI